MQKFYLNPSVLRISAKKTVKKEVTSPQQCNKGTISHNSNPIIPFEIKDLEQNIVEFES
jgi:hypothetical protein